jgi:hypothetical protein
MAFLTVFVVFVAFPSSRSGSMHSHSTSHPFRIETVLYNQKKSGFHWWKVW